MLGTKYAEDHRCVGACSCIPRAQGSRTTRGLQRLRRPLAGPSRPEAPAISPPYQRAMARSSLSRHCVGLQSVSAAVKTASESSSPQPSIRPPRSSPTVLRNTGLIVSRRVCQKLRDA